MSHPLSHLQRTESLDQAAIQQSCRQLRMPTMAAQFAPLAQAALREGQSHLQYLDALLTAEVEERERRAIEGRLREAHLPRVKTLDEFDFAQVPNISAVGIRTLAEGGYIQRSEPIIFIGDCGTGKTHLATSLCVAACRQKKRVRFATAAGLVNELVEAQHLSLIHI